MGKLKIDFNSEKTQKIVAYIVLATFLIPMAFLIVRIILAPSVQSNESNLRVKSDYVLMLVQCILGVFAIGVPTFFSKKLKFAVPTLIYYLYMIFLYCAIFLGEVRNFYYVVPHWDTILHTFSGAMLGALGFSFISFLNKEEKSAMKMSPIFVAVFAFSFAVMLGVLWEIYEFTFDGLLGLNMQKFMLEDKTQLVGRAALTDTMKDLIVDAVGAFIMSFLGYFSLKNKKGWFDSLL